MSQPIEQQANAELFFVDINSVLLVNSCKQLISIHKVLGTVPGTP